MSLMPPHINVVDSLLSNLREAVEEVKQHPELSKKGTAAMYGNVGTYTVWMFPRSLSVSIEVLLTLHYHHHDHILDTTATIPDGTIVEDFLTSFIGKVYQTK